MKLVADIDSIMSNLNSLAGNIETYDSACSSFSSASVTCSVSEITSTLESYKSSIADYLSKLSTSSNEYETLVDECCTGYQENEANTKTIDIDKIDDIISNNADVTTDYSGNAANALTGLSSTEIKTSMTDATKYVSADSRVQASKFDTVNEALAWAMKTADDDSVGYSQDTRWGNPNYDCSSFVISAWQAAGIDVKGAGASYTGNMKDAFLSTGKFEWIAGTPDSSSLQPGDIVLNEGSHVEMYVGNGNNVGAHSNYDGSNGDSSGSEVNIQSYWDDSWDGVLRYTGD